MQRNHITPQIHYVAPQHVRDRVASLGRTEDIRFSPSSRRLAVAELVRNKIVVFEISVAASQDSKNIALTGVAEILSPYLHSPHGIDFIDDEKILVANRDGEACIFELPLGAMGSNELAPLAIIRSEHVSTPGSVAVIRKEHGLYEALICNNYVNSVTRHLLDLGAGSSIKNGEVLLKKWLDVPDSICVSEDMHWIAISNHNTHAVLLYKNDPSLNESSDPIGILRHINYPHGLRFTSDSRFIIVADAGSPYVNIYERDGSSWRGVRNPTLAFRILGDEDFLRGHNSREGGAKGLDINSAANVLVTTCESQPLAFFDLAPILNDTSRAFASPHSGEDFSHNANYRLTKGRSRSQEALALNYELYRGQMTAAVTAALRWVLGPLRWVLWKLRIIPALHGVLPQGLWQRLHYLSRKV